MTTADDDKLTRFLYDLAMLRGERTVEELVQKVELRRGRPAAGSSDRHRRARNWAQRLR